ncbi:hypothetical protein QR680_009741 [Steinernema hermaphroditum]|uniref:peptidylprolyl isomerase n=1 Tax=Steinernema hermaphroditum TaxID=289476 RepID=A0AA39ILI2_9BILA|nr:hypothetical protein QR680_009741 [Steinernema hermaphroditum]
MPNRTRFPAALFLLVAFLSSHPTDVAAEKTIDVGVTSELGKLKPEDKIPVIELRGEGKPMTAAQIRALEEASNGGPLDIKVEHTWKPLECPRKAKRKDFVTFHYKGFAEDGKKFDQTYGREAIRMQLGVGMAMPGLEKGLRGMCDTELRKIQIPYRLSRKNKSKVWKYIPNDEHWITLNVEMVAVEEWTLEGQFQFLDLNNDSVLTANELVKFADKMKKDFGKTWTNQDIDNVHAARYYVKYFDVDGDGNVSLDEFKFIMERDQEKMDEAERQERIPKDGRKRDPGLAWILDFNNDGVVTVAEMDGAADALEGEPSVKPVMPKKDEL